MGRLAHRIHAKSAPQAYRAGDKERCGAYSAALHKAWFLACIANACRSYALLGTTSAAINTSAAIKAWSLAGIAKPAAHAHSLAPPHQLPKPGLWHVSPRLPLVPTPWHHLSSYQSLVFGMYRQRCSSYALLGTPSSAISTSPIVAVRIALKRSFSTCLF